MNHPAGIDLAQFHAAFFEEAAENIDRLERLLLDVDPARPDDEHLNAVFRCAHSVKGGAATFAFDDVAALTHAMETLLDRLRRHELAVGVGTVDALLACADALRALLDRHQGRGGEAPDVAALQARLQALAAGAVAGAAPAGAPAGQGAEGGAPARVVELRVEATDDPAAIDGLLGLFDDIADLGRIEPADDGAAAGDGSRRFRVHTDAADDELLDLFAFHVDRSKLRLAPCAQAGPAAAAPAGVGTPAAVPPAPPARPHAAPPAEAATLRVGVDKVDRLLDAVGELVVAQSALAETCAALDTPARRVVAGVLADVQRQVRRLQDEVLAVRMVPVATLFARFPRLVRDLAGRLGKQVAIDLQGGSTELDKGLVEPLVDPLTHLVRNAVDHGIEPAAERVARGKPAAGTVTLAATQESGAVVVEVRDDGAGLSRERLLAKARERGLHAPDSLTDGEVWSLIFAPGFSTAAAVTEVSGRGVGMDVVQRNVAAIGGRVDVESRAGEGLTVRIRLPLTLAIVEGLVVRVADERYVVPLDVVVESLGLGDAPPRAVAGAPVLRWRDEVLPLVDLRRRFGLPERPPAPRPVALVVEAEGRRAALRVDALVGPRPVVVKSLATHVGRVDGVCGATVLGDGRVALIVDVAALCPAARGRTGLPPGV